MTRIIKYIQSEPVAIAGLASALLALALAFGLHLSKDQVAALSAVGSALFALIARAKVSPVKDAK